MKIKRLLSMILCFVLVLGVVGCKKDAPAGGTNDNGEAIFKAGTYTATAKGNNGDVTVEVVFDATSIVSVTVKEHDETPGLSDAPIERIPTGIVEGQTLLVDTVAGATMTSNAILTAVEDCITQAGGDVAVFKTASGSDNNNKTETELTTDVVVVGGGGTGLAAAASAYENGADVIVLEKLAVVGGSTALSGGAIGAPGTRFQEEIGVKDTKQSWIELWKERQALSNREGKYPDYDRVDKFMDEAVVTTHWLVDTIKHKYSKVDGFGFDPVKRLHSPEGDKGSVITGNIENYLTEKGVKILTETKATKLMTDDNGDVIGVMAESIDGIIKINAKKVILASGGFAKNEELLSRLIPEMAGTAELSAASAGSTGDGIIMAEEVGATLYEEPWVIGLGITTVIPELKVLDWDSSKILVNEKGERFFNEASHYSIVTNKVSEQEKVWMIIDSKEANGNVVELLKNALPNEELATGNSIEELAKEMAVSEESLTNTITNFNKTYETGKDEFGKAKELMVPVTEGPYYALRFYPRTMGTFGGVKTDEHYRVLKEDGSVINNLYAGGECSNKVMYNQVYMTGSSVQLALTSGRISGAHAAQSIK